MRLDRREDIDTPAPEELFKCFGVLWEVDRNRRHGNLFINRPHCPNETCRTTLLYSNENTSFLLSCNNCKKVYTLDRALEYVRQDVQARYEGFKMLDWKVYSLELPPTRVKDVAQDDNYWVEARISQKEGKKMAVVYFGEKKDVQTKLDYSQLFIDFDDELLRFDKGNKNPLKIIGKLLAEFPGSIVSVNKKKEGAGN